MKTAKTNPAQLAAFMGLKKGHGKSLKAFCDAAQDICNAWAQEDLKESHAASQALNMTAVWLLTTGITDPDDLKDLPLHVRFFINEAKTA